MKIKNLLICIFLSISNLAYSANDTVDQDIANSKNIDELIKKMNQAEYKDRYKYMNAIKQQLASTKEREREKKIAELLDKIQHAKETSQGRNGSLGNGSGSEANGGNAGDSSGNGGNGGNGGGEGNGGNGGGGNGNGGGGR